MQKSIVFIDTEVSTNDEKIHDIGAVRENGDVFHGASADGLFSFTDGSGFICGHNIIHHDLVFLKKAADRLPEQPVIDTLYLSPLLFPNSLYHSLLKDDKLQSDELNNPVNDSKKAMDLFYQELNAFRSLPETMKNIYHTLLSNVEEFRGFFIYLGQAQPSGTAEAMIRSCFKDMICTNSDLKSFISNYPAELAYALSLISAHDSDSITPPWLMHHFPQIETIVRSLRNTPCKTGCPYCRTKLNIHLALKNIFGYDTFRQYNGEPLQEMAAQAAVDGKSLLAVFPTGGGKSITFQLPALMAGRTSNALTVVISPLQSLMKDQVDNLSQLGISEAVTINGLLDPIERANAIERVANGSADLLYISPEQLRSKTIEKLLVSRSIARFVIDEAHCFSAWGQDFRVDYLYIGDFIRRLQELRQNSDTIPVSCFTATAKQKVISDICDYFRQKLNVNLSLFTSAADRENLHYMVLHQDTDEEKYNTLRSLIAENDCPAIVYVSRTKRTRELAEKLTADGFPARAFNGKMSAAEKVENQEAFIRNDVRIIVATSAFGMGVDKKDVRLVVHYDISDSLENYVQEAGRAGRDPQLQAKCYVLYNDADLDKHFILLNQTKLSISEIQQVWQAIKAMTKKRPSVCCSALEIARQAGWDDSVSDIETRVRTAVSALEHAGYVKRGRNVPRVYATGIQVKNMEEAVFRIDKSPLFSHDDQRKNAKRIIRSLISSRSIAGAGNDEAESRIDYLADTLGISKNDVIGAVNLMRQDGLLADTKDMSAYISSSDTKNKSMLLLNHFSQLEKYVLGCITENGCRLSLKEINDQAVRNDVAQASIKNIRTLIYYLIISGYLVRSENENHSYSLTPALSPAEMTEKFHRRIDICSFILEMLYSRVSHSSDPRAEKPVQFSVVELLNEYQSVLFLGDEARSRTTLHDIEDALLYLSKINALKLEGGFLVLYNAMEINRLVMDNKIRYKIEDYRFLDEFYQQKIRQIHIVGEYANLMTKDYQAALTFVHDYFQMDFKKFIAKYFKGDRSKEISRNITPQKYHKLFGELSGIQSEIINDAESKYIVAAAGPGSGKTRVLVHKLASLLLLEDVKHEQLLMLTFSRAAATEFKKRLIDLIGNAANFVEIKTFHSYCFELLGRIGSLEDAGNVVADAAALIENGEVEQRQINKRVLVIDEAQDMDENEFNLVRALMRQNDDMRIIAVGDDDQNIYEFRGSDSRYMRRMIEEFGAKKYEMTENYRSCREIVSLANAFVSSIGGRMKSSLIRSVRTDSGRVSVTRYPRSNMYEAVADQIAQEHTAGTVCVLTHTNSEALQMQSILNEKGIHAKLIQSMDRFRLCNLTEIKFLLSTIKEHLTSPIITDETWEYARRRITEKYAASACLENILCMMEQFEAIFPVRYFSDLQEFISESNYEDFYRNEQNAVIISTIHKAKGKEFDTVYMLLRNTVTDTDEQKRGLYVGITRAKTALFIHTNTQLFDQYHSEGIRFFRDISLYPFPREITLQMTYKDVHLDFFSEAQDTILTLTSGSPLQVNEHYLSAVVCGRVRRVVRFSGAFNKRVEKLRESNYFPHTAFVRFIVEWKNQNTEEEIPILLADVVFRRAENLPSAPALP